MDPATPGSQLIRAPAQIENRVLLGDFKPVLPQEREYASARTGENRLWDCQAEPVEAGMSLDEILQRGDEVHCSLPRAVLSGFLAGLSGSSGMPASSLTGETGVILGTGRIIRDHCLPAHPRVIPQYSARPRWGRPGSPPLPGLAFEHHWPVAN